MGNAGRQLGGYLSARENGGFVEVNGARRQASAPMASPLYPAPATVVSVTPPLPSARRGASPLRPAVVRPASGAEGAPPLQQQQLQQQASGGPAATTVLLQQ